MTNQTNPKQPLRVAAYARFSTTNQLLKVGGFIDSQVEQIANTARYKSQLAEHNDGATWEIVDVYREEGRSGKNTDRPEFQRLLRDLKAGLIDVVVVTKIDRITRSLVDFYDLWELFEKQNVEFISLGDNFETTTAIGRAMLKITLVFAELERERTSERTKEKVHARMNKGKWFGGSFPFGYAGHPDDKTTFVIVPELQKVLRENIFEKYLEMPSIRSLVRYLNEQGIHSPKHIGRRGQKVGGAPMNVEKLRMLLSDRRLIAKSELENGDIVDCNWEPVLDEELFNRVQSKLPRNSGRRPANRTKSRVYLLEGLVKCGKCGHTMTYAKAKGRTEYYYYYRCNNKHRSASSLCKRATFRQRD
ncbi:MAG: recombinase family protein [Deltaproteobacteria bacterium]|nr:recombinase family protein [Deltaproteobacteria bacterium]